MPEPLSWTRKYREFSDRIIAVLERMLLARLEQQTARSSVTITASNWSGDLIIKVGFQVTGGTSNYIVISLSEEL